MITYKSGIKRERERESLSVRSRYVVNEKDVRFWDTAKMMWYLTVECNAKEQLMATCTLDIHVITKFTKLRIFLDARPNNNWITRNSVINYTYICRFQCTTNYTLLISCNLDHVTYHFPIKVVAVFVLRVFERTKPRVKCAVPFASLQQKIYNLFSRNI